MNDNHTAQKDIRDYLRLTNFVKPHLAIFITAIISMLFFSLFEKVSITAIIPLADNILMGKSIPTPQHAPVFVVSLVDKINNLPKLRLFGYILIFFPACYLLRCFFNFLYGYFMSDLGQLIIRDIRNILYKKFLSLSLTFYAKNPTGQVVSRVTYDATLIKDAISEGLRDFIVEPIQIVMSVIVAMAIKFWFNIPWSLLFLSLVCIPAIILSVTGIGRRLRKISRKQQEQMGDINTSLYDTISGIRIVQAFSMEPYEIGRFSGYNSRFYKTAMKSIFRMQIIGPITEAVTLVCIGPIAWIAFKEILSGSLSGGAFGAFIAAVFLMIKPVKRISKLYAIVQQALAAAVRIFAIQDEKVDVEEKRAAAGLRPFKDTISFEHVGFSYGENVVLKDINFTVNKGEIVAFVGASGAGKTTLVNLLPRFYDAARGAIKIDGADITDATLKSLRSQIGIVTQDTILFNDTVSANVSYGNVGKAAREDIIKAAKIANAHDFIIKMPQGYETAIGEKGFRLSGGEKQRLAIARAVFKNPPILILDEATSQLDAESELLVQDAIDRLMKGRTVFAIAHRLATIKNATRILVLNNGVICEQGTHDELIKKSGLYQRLYNLQFQLT